ncbi:hypothetical protein [Blastococcus sp. SYSU DS0619]
MLGALAAATLGVGHVEIRKNEMPLADSDAWLQRTTGPDYRGRHLSLSFRRELISAGDRVLFVDDSIEPEGQGLVSQALVESAGAT